MRSYKLILCPTDLSPGADEALGQAAALAVANDAALLVVFWRADGQNVSTGLFEESMALNVSPDIVGSLKWEGLVVSGTSAAEAIARVAAERHVDLIVMRSRRRPLGAALLGSTAEAISRIAPCPVLVTHPGERDSGLRIERILVAYDFWDDSEIALQHALLVAAESGAEVHLLHAVPPHEDDSPELAWAARGIDSQVHRVARRLEGAAPEAAALGVKVISHVASGQPYREILAFAEANDVDLVCMGARGRDFGARSLFGSNSDRVLRQSPCPVLIARPLRPATTATRI